MDILVVMTEGIGNMVMMTPALQAMKQARPECNITVLCKEPAASVIRGWDVIERAISRLGQRRYDIGFLSIWSGKYKTEYRDRLGSKCNEVIEIDYEDIEKHEAEYHLDMACYLEYEGDLPDTFCMSEDVHIKHDKPLAALSDTCLPLQAWQRKRWPYYPALAKMLIAKGFDVCLIGGKSEAEAFNPGDWPDGVINCLGKYTIPQTAGLLGQCNVFVGNDSGPAHIAAAMGCNTFVLFGPTLVKKNKQLGRNVVLLTRQLECSPCQYTARWQYCHQFDCMLAISPTDVMQAIDANTHEGGATAERLKLSVCMIVKNEEAMLAGCLDSVKDIADEIIVVDTGSTDRTMEIAQGYEKVKLFEHPWEDSFSVARNQAISHATGDWILQIDADEKLEKDDIPVLMTTIQKAQRAQIGAVRCPHCSRKIVDEKWVHAFKLEFLNYLADGVSWHASERLFRNGHIEFKCRVHNQPHYDGIVAPSIPVKLHHYGYNLDKATMQKKYERTERLLKISIEETPIGDKQLGFFYQNLLRNFRAQYKWDELVETADRMFAMMEAGEITPSSQTEQLSMIDYVFGLVKQEKPMEALMAVDLLVTKHPLMIDGWYHKALIHSALGHHGEAIAAYDSYLKYKRQLEAMPQKPVLILDTWGGEATAYNNMGCAYFYVNDPGNALLHFGIAAKMDPDNEGFKNNVNQVLGAILENFNKQQRKEPTTEELKY